MLMVAGLLAQAVLDSALGAWIAFGSVIALMAIGLLGKIGLWPANWPGVFGGDDSRWCFEERASARLLKLSFDDRGERVAKLLELGNA